MRKLTRGADLHPDDQRAVLARFVHRFTRDHVPAWAKRPRPDGRPYRVQFDSDHDWLVNTEFVARADGRLDGRFRSCTSWPTWPEGKE